ncbi:eomesodermin homolog a isoform X1 [Gadus morhua]|uniref:T-box domain-containing protein n=1 Tax=Gadus morhua TaxID=8049 RepID=A0A8C4YXF5_GADMO|nr:eomesodermin-like isoform X1 [Gadus morhua]XP_056439526.1 eomesodermin homolog a isoform X1 [Gadus chalcogrammus]
MQLENILPSSSINLPKTFYNLSSSDSANNSPGSSQIEYQEVERTETESTNAPKKYLSGAGMMGEGEGDTFSGTKTAPDGRKGSPVLGGVGVGVAEDDLTSGRRYNIDDLGSDRYFISSSQAGSDMANPCSLFPYAGQTGSVYSASNGSRYSASLHYGSVLPPAGFSSSVCSSRSQFAGGGYQFGQGPGCLYPSYPATGSSIGSMSLPGSAAGARAQVYLCNRPLWLKFHRHQTEMIITKQGRRMFPFLSFNITGLNLTAHYNVFVEVILADPNHWRFQGGKWVTCGKADNNMQGNKMYVHPESPNTGAHWMRQEISFGKLKLTNNKGANNNNTQMIVLQSLHKYQPRLHIVEVTEEGVEDMSNEAKTQTFTFPENQFIAVTAYQNTDITQLKIDHNPFAKGFRDNYDSRMYTAPESDRLTPSPTDSPRSHQIVPGARYAMQPFFQDQFVNQLPQNRFYASERAVPQTNSILSPQGEDAGAGASAQRWFVTPVQQAGSNKLDLSYENDYSAGSLLSYGIKPLPLQTSHALSYYPDSAFASMAAGWGSRSTYQRKVTTGLPWSPRPSPPAFPEEQLGAPTKDKLPEESAPPSSASNWLETSHSLKSVDSTDSGVYSMVCKRRRMSPGGSSTENSPSIKCEDLTTDEYNKDNPKGMGYYAFYTSP